MRHPRTIQAGSAVRTFLLLLPIGAGACAPDAGDHPVAGTALRSDSAGVEIVLVPTAAPDAAVFATLAAEPTLMLGSLEGRPEEQFGSVPALVPLPDGGVAVVDGQAAEVRLFGPDGAHRASFGSSGAGPGEFQSPSAVALLPGDTLAVWDSRPVRVTRFALDGTLGPTVTLGAETRGRPFRVSFFPDGRVVGQSRWFPEGGGGIPPEGENTLVLDSAVLTVFAPAGTLEDTLQVLPGREAVRRVDFDGRSISVRVRTAVFGRDVHFAAHPDGVWAGWSGRFELRLLDAVDGHVLRILRAPALERPTTEQLASAIRDAALAEADGEAARRDLEEWFQLSPRPALQPAYDALLVDDAARLWVQEWSGPDGPGRRWWVFSRDGDLLGRVDVPADVTLMAVRAGEAWGILRDDLDVSYVVRYPLETPVS